VYVLLSTYTALRLSQICGGLCQTRKTPTLVACHAALKNQHSIVLDIIAKLT
jgi:hypothetical protein